MSWFHRFFRAGESDESKTPDPGRRVDSSKHKRSSIIDVKARFGRLAQPAIHLRATESAGFSKLGGLPRLPEGIAWPVWNEKPQAFLAQIDLAEIHGVLPSFLPATGLLYFFYDQEQSVWGFDPKDRGGWAVIYRDVEPSSLRECAAPTELDANFIYAEKLVSPHRVDVWPDWQRLPDSAQLSDRDSDAYWELQDAPFAELPRHQMLGFPTPVQGDHMELECQLASNGIYVGNESGYRDPRCAELEPGASEWKLLLQLDSDEDAGWMWGDAGSIYFWIREADARRADFSKAWFCLQCG